MKRIRRIICLTVIMLGLCYIGPAYYYAHNYASGSGEKVFMYGTYINGVYCTGLTVDETLRAIPKDYRPEDAVLLIKDVKYDIDMEKIGYIADYETPVRDIMNKQSPWSWYKQLWSENSSVKVDPIITIDEEGFSEFFDSLDLKEEKPKGDEVYIELTENGYELIDGKKPILNAQKVKSYLFEQLKANEKLITIDDSFYECKEYTAKEKELMRYFDELEIHQRRLVTYVFGKETKRISKREWAELMNTSDELLTRITPDMAYTDRISYTIDEDKAEKYIADFLDEYNTYNNRYFRGHNGALVHVTKGNYGNKLDIALEKKWFREFVNSGLDYATRTPVYLIEAKYREKNDFGNTFIEVSLDEQYLWYYVDGQVFVETPITSGSYAHGGTDPRVVYVYTKIPNKWLTGPTWHSFVKYWVAIQGAIGIHDASWRSVYGGDEYKYRGSHGCINTPEEAMKKIYDNVEIGTPVIVYSIEKNGVDE